MAVGCTSTKKDREKEKVDFDELIEEAIEDYSDDLELPFLEVFDEDFDDDSQEEHIAFFGEEGDIQAAICMREDLHLSMGMVWEW